MSERLQGATDLNGDLDHDDFVLHLYDFDAGATINLGAVSAETTLGEDALLFFVRESSQGNADLNGDGDALDIVLHVFNLTSGVITNVGLPTSAGTRFEGGLLAFPVYELSHGSVDLNSDGDTEDTVMHVFDVRTETPSNLMLDSPALPYQWSEEYLAFLVSEAAQGNADLNRDGDTSDFVMHLYDGETSSTRNLEVEADLFSFFDFNNHLLAWRVGEYGEKDLNGDGDTFDLVFHVYDADAGTTVNTGLAAGGGLRVVQDLVLLSAEEAPFDLNDDGDSDDSVLHIFDRSTGTIENTRIAANVELLAPWQFHHERFIAFHARESDGGTDLNGDGDATDRVAHVFDGTTKTFSNLGLATRATGLAVFDDHVIAMVSEMDHGRGDLNGDGDEADEVLHVFDTRTGVTRNLGLATRRHGSVDGRWFAFHVDEELQGGIDLNGDGDANDRVLHLADLWSTPERRLPFLVEEVDAKVTSGDLGLFQGRLLLSVLNEALSEIQQGSDLRGAYFVWIFMLLVALYALFGALPPDSAEALIDLATIIVQQLTS